MHGGKGDGRNVAKCRLEHGADGTAVQGVFAKIEPAIDAGKNQVKILIEPQGGKTNAVDGSAVHTISRNAFYGVTDLFCLEGYMNVDGVTFAALLTFGGAHDYFAKVHCPLGKHFDAFGIDAVVVNNQNSHSQPSWVLLYSCTILSASATRSAIFFLWVSVAPQVH